MMARIVLVLCAAALAACQTTGSSTGDTPGAAVAAGPPDPRTETTIIDGKTFRIALPDDQCIVREQQSSEPVQKLRYMIHEVSERSDVAVLGIFAPCRLLDRWSAGEHVGKPTYGLVIAARTDGHLVDLGPAITEQIVFDDIEQRLRDGRMNRAIARGRKAAREMADLFLRDPRHVNPAYRSGYRLARRDASAIYLRQQTSVEIGGEVVHGSDWLAITLADRALVYLDYATTADQQDDARTLQVLRTVVASLRGESAAPGQP